MVYVNPNVWGQVNRNKNISTGNGAIVSSPESMTSRSLNDDAYTTSGVEYKFDFGTETGMYLDEKWQPGEIVLTDGTVINDRLLRYNIYSRQMEFVDKNDTMAIANTIDVKELKIGDRKFIMESFVFDNEPVNDWVEVLVEGDYTLLLYRRIVYRYVESLTETNTENDRFFMTEKYYVRENNGEIKELPNTKRQVVKCLSEKNPGIDKFIRRNKIKLSKEADVIKLMEYCNKKGKQESN